MHRSVIGFCIASCLLIFYQGLAQEWEWQNPLPQGNRLCDAAFINPDTGWAVGRNTLIRTTDGGETWSINPNIGSYFCSTVRIGGTAWIAAGSVWRSTDAGATWDSLSNLSEIVSYNYLCFIDENCGWLGSYYHDQIAHTIDGGDSWTYHSVEPHMGVQCISFVDSLNGWAICSGCLWLTRTRDGGQTWTEVASTNNHYSFVAFTDTLDGMSIYGTAIKRTVDGGVTWTTLFNDSSTQWTTLTRLSTDTCFAAGPNGILRTVDGGANWILSYEPGPCQTINRLVFVDNLLGYAVGNSGLILQTSDGGGSWLTLSQGWYCELQAVDFVDSLNGWTVGAEGAILHTIDGGTQWLVQTNVTNVDLTSVDFLNLSTGLIGGNDGLILRTDNGGETWSDRSCTTIRPITELTLVDSLHGWAMGSAGPIFYTEDGGETWLERLPGNSTFHRRLSVVSVNEAWAMIGSPIVHTTDSGLTWDTLDVEHFEDICFTDPLYGWGIQHVAGLDIIVSTSDGGSTWEQRFAGQTNTSLAELFVFDSLTVWVLSGSVFFCTSDGGDHWEIVPKEGSVNDLAIVDSAHIWMIGSEAWIRRFIPDANTTIPELRIDPMPMTLSLCAYPNPFNPSTTLSFDLPQAGRVQLQVFDIMGRLVDTLENRVMPAGTHSVPFGGNNFASGIYFVNLRNTTSSRTQKLILLK